MIQFKRTRFRWSQPRRFGLISDSRFPHRIWLTLLALLPLNCRHVESETDPASESTCSLKIDATVPVRSAEGKYLYVEPQSLTLNGSDVVVIGAPVAVLEDTNVFARMNGAPVAGVSIDRTGRATYIPAPEGWPAFASPRVLYEAASGWHTIWAEESSNADSGIVQLVYGLFDGHRWTRVSRIGRFGRSWWGPNSPSQLIRAKDGLVLAAPVNQGMTLLAEREGVWNATTVPPAHSAGYSALYAEEDALVLAYAGYDASDSVALAVTRSPDGGATWSTPVAVSFGVAHDPVLVRVGDSLALIWLAQREVFQRQGIRFSLSRDHGTSWSPPAPLTGAEAAKRFSYASVLRDQLLLVGEVDSLGATRQTWHAFDRSGRARRILNQRQTLRWPTLASDRGERLSMLADTGSATALVSVLSHLTLSCRM
jgi:hypothetical protein